jgi:hypothetical protein
MKESPLNFQFEFGAIEYQMETVAADEFVRSRYSAADVW